MASKTVEIVEKIVTPFAENLGLEIIEIEYTKKFNGMNLTIYIHKDGGVSIDDCEKLHRLIDEPLDIANPTDDKPYILNVSSPGLDRPLKSQKDFDRNIGKELQIKFYAPYQNKKEIDGVLTEFKDQMIILKTEDDKIHQIKLEDAAKVTLKIKI